MSVKVLDGKKLARMLIEGARNLERHAKIVDALNVFPVPDGDTGTNMNLSMASGVKEVKRHDATHVSDVATSFSKGLLMGARGNSGVILSQLFRGFAKGVEGKAEVNALMFATALEQGVQMAYKAVMKPVEGTILTVAKDAARQAKNEANKNDDLVVVVQETVKEAQASLKRTPDLLPVLKEVGVIDSGGQGLVYIYEGMQAVLTGETLSEERVDQPSMDDLVKVEHHHAQSHLATEDIEFGYCTEVMVKFEAEKLSSQPYEETGFREELSQLGDSLLVVSDEQLLKIHIHAEYPGEVVTKAQHYGSLLHVKVENMREQHSHLLEKAKAVDEQPDASKEERVREKSQYGIVAVSMGDGIEQLFKGLGADVVIPGGQTMNPSTEDIVSAIKAVHADVVFILPNNSNIIMAAEQAAEVADGRVVVIPTKTVPQGLAALMAFTPHDSMETTEQVMKVAMSEVKTGQVTYAVRDTTLEGIEISKGDFIGMAERKIVTTSPDAEIVTRELIDFMIDEESEIITILTGEEANEVATNELVSYIEGQYSDVEVEVHNGNQPLYSYIVAVE